jgi:ergothioneine biosynthesis protein EgtB
MTASTATVAPVFERLEAAWKRSDRMFELLAPAALAERPIALRHPLVFYVGHLPAFTWNMLGRGVLRRESPRPEFDRLFDFGIDPEEGQEPEDAHDWPSLEEIHRYRDAVRERVRASWPDVERRAGEHPLAERGRIYHLVLEHELMHHETLLYMFQELAHERKRGAAWWSAPVTGPPARAARRVRVPAGEVTLGADLDGPRGIEFGWDNELPERRVRVGELEIASLPVSIGEYLRFVEDGGYAREELWDPEGWEWTRRHGRELPKDWARRAGGLVVRAMLADHPLRDAAGWPVSVSWAEARAYARWRGARLPSEPELHLAAYGPSDEPVHGKRSPRRYPWGDDAPVAPRHGNFGFAHHSPTPVGSHPGGASALGVEELLGNGWEWTSTPFLAHEGFAPTIPEYAGYSRDSFDGKHYVLFGGSWATDPKLLRRSFRNWFRFNYPYPFTQFRLAWDA